MHLIIDGYNLLHVGRSPVQITSEDLHLTRDRLIEGLALYRQMRPCNITVVFDGWQGGWATERKERRRGLDILFSRLGETADEVIRRLIKEKGSGVVVVTSDREISRYAEKLSAAVIPSDRFREKMMGAGPSGEKDAGDSAEEGRGMKKRGPSRRQSKKEKRLQTALKKL